MLDGMEESEERSRLDVVVVFAVLVVFLPEMLNFGFKHSHSSYRLLFKL